MWDFIKNTNISVIRVPGGKKKVKGTKKYSKT